jgi:hypothetical protein
MCFSLHGIQIQFLKLFFVTFIHYLNVSSATTVTQGREEW